MNRERESTKKTRELIRRSYDKIIRKINSGEGRIVIAENVYVDAGKTLRKADIYALVAQDIGLDYSESTVEKYVREYNHDSISLRKSKKR
jgi:hypothetical protein